MDSILEDLLLAAGASRVTGTQVLTIELFDFGSPAHVTTPPGDQVSLPTARGPGVSLGTKAG